MAFNGSGTFNRTNGTNTGSTLWDDDKNDGTNIVSGRHDTHDQDVADGLTQCITKDGQTTVTADIPFNSNNLTQVGEVQSTSGSAITVSAEGSAKVRLKTNSTVRWDIESDGDIVPVVDNTYDIGSSGSHVKDIHIGNEVVCPTTAVAATGTTQSDAAEINTITGYVTSADGTKGVKLPDDSSPGSIYFIYNSSSSVLKLYPHSGGFINSAAEDVAVDVAANETAIVHLITSTNWVGGVLANF